MPPLDGFSNNPFKTHADLKTASIALLRALKPYQSPHGARIKVPLSTGTHFDDVAAQLEGYARPLWAVGALMHSNIVSEDEYEELIKPYALGLANGTNPNHEDYWGPVVLRDQRMVEMEIISFALLSAPETMFHSQTEEAKRHIREWLETINGKDFPTTNWLWFRVMTNLALIKVCDVPKEHGLDAMKADLDLMEQFYRGDGWAADGIWSDGGRQADYYSGSFAIQFSQLIYAKMAQDLDPERCERFRSRAKEFAVSFWRYFDTNGAAIPFGRSLTYRFAFAGFWSVVAFAELELPEPLNDWGVIKGLLLRHFRWWSKKDDMFNIDGTLTIGFTYPNMYTSEDYNSPQSPYWAMKSFLALGLREDHPFWTVEEKPLPIGEVVVMPVEPAMHILCNQSNHHFLLSMGQFCPWPLKATEAKYGKFAYSSHFGFSVPTGTLIQQIAPDSTLAVSKDGGETWRVPWKVTNHCFATAQLMRNDEFVEDIPCLTSTWKPWADADITVQTHIVAPCSRWPDWYIRWHRFTNNGSSVINIQAVQGGFAIQGRGDKYGEVLPTHAHSSEFSIQASRNNASFPQGTVTTQHSALICSNAGASGITALNSDSSDYLSERTYAEVLKPDANTNLMWQRTLIPTVRNELSIPPNTRGQPVSEFGSAVFALARTKDREERYAGLSYSELWGDVPVLDTGRGKQRDGEWCIRLE
ncbi:uncharacterized protein J4E78_007374 [Alternaria triticimaculans]|uniref:uncharacterized protein n=1 Tax=Alternaria triticimaculans TaxID=297637 RepID=UPI0020C3893E|nr:uncharacterized protein J4E78_007374 [Alternaria triticimaculans]KAI4654329.1 hypothetical protein J4E78_007374 [Alternaria triticimaculans]